MKKYIIIFLLLSFSILEIQSQIPYAFQYQFVMRDNNGQILSNQPVMLQIGIYKLGSTQPAYSEVHRDTTNEFGLISIKIGQGSQPQGDFKKLEWGIQSYELGVTVNEDVLPRSPIVAVPLALWAKSSGDWVNVGDSTLYTLNKFVGIGTNNPTTPLDVYGQIRSSSSYPKFSFFNSSTRKEFYWEMSDGHFYLYDPQLQSYRLFFHENGNTGINTLNPQEALDVNGKIRISGTYPAFVITNSNGKQLYYEMSGGGEYYLFDPALQKYRLFFHSNGNVGIGTSNPQKELDVNGTTRTKVLEITGGGDPAEYYAFSEKMDAPEGSVVVIDSAHPGKLELCRKAYDQAVVGVISGAGDIRPGITFKQEGVLEGEHPVAMGGRVMVKAIGPIAPRDLLTTSSTPGHAMAATKARRIKPGTVIGKSMGTLRKGEIGLVMMVVQPN